MHRNVNGFTLIEVMMAMAVIAILIGVAASAWRHARSAAGAGSVRADLVTTLLDAVHHAAITGSEVVVCPNSLAGQCSGRIEWDRGWMAFADVNGNRIHDAGEALLRKTAALESGIHLHTTAGRTRLVFHPNGGNVGSNVTFTLCDSRGPAHATSLVMANSGRLRQGKPSEAAANACAYGS